jgi:hypothetical protein
MYFELWPLLVIKDIPAKELFSYSPFSKVFPY